MLQDTAIFIGSLAVGITLGHFALEFVRKHYF